MTHQLDDVLNRIDAANADDPNTEIVNGEPVPAALIYGRRMSDWVDRLRRDAPDELKIAARAQHIRRWDIPRSRFPMDRAGYHKWRTTLYGYHGDQAAEIMRDCGCDEAAIERVKFILSKKKLKSDPDVQTLEDAAALVFLENHFLDFFERDDIDEQKMIGILKKTWAKMSDRGREAALNLDLPAQAKDLVAKALV